MDKLSGCNCCGCPGKDFEFYPAYALPTFTSLVEETRAAKTYRKEVTTVYEPGEDPVVTETAETIESTVNTNTDSTDNLPAVGDWTFTDVKSAETVINNISDTTDGGGIRTVVDEVLRYGDDINIIRKLVIEFDVSWVKHFGIPSTLAPFDVLRSMWMRYKQLPFTILDFDLTVIDPDPVINRQVTLKGWKIDEALPVDFAAFDAIYGPLPQSATTIDDFFVNRTLDLSTDMVGTNGTTLSFYCDFIGTNGGAEWDEVRLGWSNLPYDPDVAETTDTQNINWIDEWDNPTMNVYESLFTVPIDSEVQIPFLNTVTDNLGWTIQVELLDSLDATVFDLTLSAEEIDNGIDAVPRYTYRIKGNSPDFTELDFGIEQSFNLPFPAPMSITLRLREEAVEIGEIYQGYWVTSNEEGLPTKYRFYPHYDTLLEAQYRIRISFSPGTMGEGVALDDFVWHGLAYPATEKNPECPPGTCAVIEPYTHTPWRSDGLEFGGAFAGWDYHEHDGCITTLVGQTPTPCTTRITHKTANFFLEVHYGRDDIEYIYNAFGAEGDPKADPFGIYPVHVYNTPPGIIERHECTVPNWVGDTDGFAIMTATILGQVRYPRKFVDTLGPDDPYTGLPTCGPAGQDTHTIAATAFQSEPLALVSRGSWVYSKLAATDVTCDWPFTNTMTINTQNCPTDETKVDIVVDVEYTYQTYGEPADKSPSSFCEDFSQHSGPSLFLWEVISNTPYESSAPLPYPDDPFPATEWDFVHEPIDYFDIDLSSQPTTTCVFPSYPAVGNYSQPWTHGYEYITSFGTPSYDYNNGCSDGILGPAPEITTLYRPVAPIYDQILQRLQETWIVSGNENISDYGVGYFTTRTARWKKTVDKNFSSPDLTLLTFTGIDLDSPDETHCFLTTASFAVDTNIYDNGAPRPANLQVDYHEIDTLIALQVTQTKKLTSDFTFTINGNTSP